MARSSNGRSNQQRRSPGVLLAAAALALLVVAPARAALAQSPPPQLPPQNGAGATGRSPSEVALARAEFNAGVRASRENRWPEALARFSRAYQLVPQPQMLLNLAGAQARVGRLVAAAESYRRFLREVTAGPLAVHRPAARAALAQIEPQIAHVTLAVTAGAGAGGANTGTLAPGDQVVLDGETVSAAVLGAALPVDPGTHVVTVTRGGAEVARASVEVAPGASREVALAVPPPPAPGTETAATRPVEVAVHRAGNGAAGVSSGETGTGGPDRSGAARAVAGLDTRGANGTPHPRVPPRGAPGGRPRDPRVIASPWFWTGMVVFAGGVTAASLYFAGVFDPPRVMPPVAGNVPPYLIMAP